MIEDKEENRLSIIVVTVSKLLFGLILIFGLYIVMHGHLTPGGGFQGGVLMAASVFLLYVAFGNEIKKSYNKGLLTLLESLGGLSFLMLALVGLLLGIAFFYNDQAFPFFHGTVGSLNSAGLIPYMNLAVGLKVCVGISTALFAIALFNVGEREEEE